MKLRIMHLLYSEAWGGLELYTVQYIAKLIHSGIPCVLYCKKNTKVYLEAKNLNIPICTKNKIISLLDFRLFTHVHVHRRQDLPLARVGVANKELGFIYSLLMMAPPKKDIYHHWIYSRINAAMSSSQLVCEDMKKNFPMPLDRIHLVRYGREELIATTSYEVKEKIYSLWKHDKNKLIFGSLNRIDPGKGVQDILEAIPLLDSKTLNQIEVWFIGDPTLDYIDKNNNPIYEKKSLELYQKLKTLALSEKFKNTLRIIPFQKNFHDYLSCMNVLILASHGETYSIAVLDAMQMGLPVIGTNSGGTIEQIGKNERGYLVTPRSPKEIATAIQFYVNHVDKIKDHGKNAQLWANKEHQWNITIDKTKELYLNSFTPREVK